MVFDIEMIKKVYSSMKDKVDIAKKVCNHPLTLSEKILYSHLWNNLENSFAEEMIMLILHLIESHVKMQLHKWLYFSLCKLEKIKLQFQQLFIVIT